MKPPADRAELLATGATLIAEASSYEGGGKTVWTDLSLWWIDDDDRPFIAVAEGKTSRPDLDDRFRAACFGTASRALSWFDATNLRDELAAKLPRDLETIFPDANVLRARRAGERRGFRGPDDLPTAIGWLYAGDEMASVNAVARRVEEDFGVPWRTVTNALNGGNAAGWATAFIRALRFFDRGAWREHRRRAREAEDRTHDSTSAIDDEMEMAHGDR